MFVGEVPTHEHIYSNGFICLDILYDKWTPLYNVERIVLSILSMMSSAKRRKKPSNDIEICKMSEVGMKPRDISWDFEDVECWPIT